MSVLRNRALLAIATAVAVNFIGLGMIVPVRVLYAESRGASLAIIGAMASSFLLSNFIFQYPAGWLADLWGRKRMMMLGMALQSVVSIAYLFVSDPVIFVVLRFFEGMVAASVLPSARALIADLIPSKDQGQAYGIFGSFMNAGFLLGPALGGLFASTTYAAAFIGSSVFRVVALLLVLLLVKETVRPHAAARAAAARLPVRALFTLPLVAVYILFLGDNIFFGFDLTLMPLWMRDHVGASVAWIGVAYAIWALPNIVGSPFGGKLADRVRRSILVFTFGLLQVPLYIAYGLFTALIPVLIILVVHGAVYSMMQPAVDASLAAASPPAARARTQGVYSAIGIGTAFLSSFAMPALYAVNFRLPLVFMAGAFGICVLVGGALLRLAELRSPLLSLRHAAAGAES